MKKTPKDLASPPILASLNAIVAVTALTGIASKAVPAAKASEMNYDVKLQKSFGQNNVDMTTYTTVATQSYQFGRPGYNNDDSKTTTDQF